MKKQFLSIFLSFCMIISCMAGLTLTASAEPLISFDIAGGVEHIYCMRGFFLEEGTANKTITVDTNMTVVFIFITSGNPNANATVYYEGTDWQNSNALNNYNSEYKWFEYGPISYNNVDSETYCFRIRETMNNLTCDTKYKVIIKWRTSAVPSSETISVDNSYALAYGDITTEKSSYEYGTKLGDIVLVQSDGFYIEEYRSGDIWTSYGSVWWYNGDKVLDASDTPYTSEKIGFTGYDVLINGEWTQEATEAGLAFKSPTAHSNYNSLSGVSVKIDPKSLDKCSISAVADQTYTGNEIKPALAITDGDSSLTLDTDYTVEFTDNKEAGTATATITGKGNYKDSVTTTFEIVKNQNSDPEDDDDDDVIIDDVDTPDWAEKPEYKPSGVSGTKAPEETPADKPADNDEPTAQQSEDTQSPADTDEPEITDAPEVEPTVEPETTIPADTEITTGGTGAVNGGSDEANPHTGAALGGLTVLMLAGAAMIVSKKRK